MIWHWFPIGMRFPVADFSDETKRACWQIALSAIYASDPNGTELFEACEPFDPVSQSPVYTCIVCYVGIKQSRAAGKTMHALDRLLARLCLCRPLVQANYLETFGPYPVLARIDETGAIHAEEAAAFLPAGPVAPMQRCEGLTVLLALASETGDAEGLTRTLGTLTADAGFRVRRMPLAFGGKGTVRALLCACGGRAETVACDGVKATLGVIPGSIAVIETGNVTAEPLIRKTLDLGLRRIWLASDEPADAGTDERLSETELVPLYGDADRILRRIGLFDAAAAADCVVTNRPDVFRSADVRLKNAPVCLSDGEEQPDRFLRSALPRIGKGVANPSGS